MISTNKTIRIIAPAGGGVDHLKLNSCSNSLISMNYKANLTSGLQREELFCAHSDDYRLHDATDALYSNTDDIIMALRGGYGSSRLLGKLALQKKPDNKKVFIGFSDITALNIFLYQNWGWNPIHGLVFSQVDACSKNECDPRNIEIVINFLNDGQKTFAIQDLKPLNNSGAKLSSISSKVTGGNLSIIQTTIGTPWEIITKDHILILEDIAEPAYKIDRMLQHLLNSNKFDQIKALVFGEFTNCANSHNLSPSDALIRMALVLEQRSIPVFQTLKIGHGYSNYPFMYGSGTTIKANQQGGYDMVINLR